MKQNKRNTFKRIMAAIICTAILVTGIGFDNPVRASAAMVKTEQLKTKLTMKPGDVKYFTLKFENINFVEKYKWTSSDKDIIRVGVDYIDENASADGDLCLEVTALKPGTANIIGTSKAGGQALFTAQVTVSQPKATAKQKACKHSWKTTKKATCERTGIKTCKKCKLQKTTKKTDHKYVTKTKTVVENDGFYHVYQCSGCDRPYSEHETWGEYFIQCEQCCKFQLRVKYNNDGTIASDSDYDKDDGAYMDSVMLGHAVETPHVKGSIGHGAWTDYIEEINEHNVTKTVTYCAYCGKNK